MPQMTFDQAYCKYRSQIERYLQNQYSVSLFDAEDITAEAFYTLFTKWDTFEDHDEAAVVTFLYRAAQNKAKEYHRKQRKVLMIHDVQNISDVYTGDDPNGLDTEGENDRFLYYLDQISRILSDKERITFEYIVVKKWLPKQIAKELNTTEICIQVRWCRIRKKLKKRLPEIFAKKL